MATHQWQSTQDLKLRLTSDTSQRRDYEGDHNHMSWTRSIANAIRRRRPPVERPRPGQIVKTEALDTWRDYPADGLTPARLVTILRAADEGAVDQALALFAQMEEKDAHLYCVANTRRLAVTGLRWQILSAAEMREGVDRTAADEAAAYARE